MFLAPNAVFPDPSNYIGEYNVIITNRNDGQKQDPSCNNKQKNIVSMTHPESLESVTSECIYHALSTTSLLWRSSKTGSSGLLVLLFKRLELTGLLVPLLL